MAEEAKAESLLDQYDLQEPDPVAAAPEPTPAITTPEPASRPRNPDGTFASAVPSVTHPDRLIRQARDLGFDAAEVTQLTTAELRELVRDAYAERSSRDTFQAIQQSRQAEPSGSQPVAQPSQQPAPSDDLDFSIDETQYTPEFVETVKNVGKTVHNVLAKKLKALEDQIVALTTHVRGTHEQTMREQIDDGFSQLGKEFENVFGSGAGNTLQKDSPEFIRRMAVLREIEANKKAGPIKQAIQKYAKALFGLQAQPAKRSSAAEPAQTSEQDAWLEAALPRPTQRKVAPEPKGRALAEAAVAKAMRENRQQEEQPSFDEFLP